MSISAEIQAEALTHLAKLPSDEDVAIAILCGCAGQVLNAHTDQELVSAVLADKGLLWTTLDRLLKAGRVVEHDGLHCTTREGWRVLAGLRPLALPTNDSACDDSPPPQGTCRVVKTKYGYNFEVACINCSGGEIYSMESTETIAAVEHLLLTEDDWRKDLDVWMYPACADEVEHG